MSVPFPGFVGPSYELTSRYASVERTVNWMLSANEDATGESKWRMALEPLPGNQAFCALPVAAPFNQPNRGLLELRGVLYGVNGTVVFSMNAAGVFTNIGTVVSDGAPCSMVANGNGQIFVASAGLGYVIPPGGRAGSLVSIPVDRADGPLFGASYATFQDGYILVVTPNSNQFQISGSQDVPLGDATLWDAGNVSVQAGQQDLLSAIVSSREYLRLFGQRRSQIYYDAGSGGIGAFPFTSYNETFIETGCLAPFSIAEMGDMLVWIGNDARGMRACWADRVFQPQRISTFAVEQIWESYAKVSDAVAFFFLWRGHLLYQITFPSAYVNPPASGFPLGSAPTYRSATWLYDSTVSALLGRHVWSERSYQTGLGYGVGRPELFHAYCYGLHLVGSGGADGNPGAIYQYADVGTYNQNPQLLLRWSNDGGNTYGPEQNVPLGLVGGYSQVVYWNRCGYSRDRVFWLRYAEESECGTDASGAQSQQAIVRDRICPHLWNAGKRTIYNRVLFELSHGIGSSDGITPSAFPLGILNAELDVIPCAS
jgi:hypothetical protein